jgi:D-xylonolactonase
MPTITSLPVRTLAKAHCGCGENPFYDGERGRVLWTDIPRGRLFALDLATGDWRRFYDGPTVGGFTLQSDGSLLLFRDRDIARLTENPDGSSQVEVLVDCSHLDTGRFNDVFADPEGRVFAGTMGRDNRMNGGLFRVERDGSVHQLWDGTGCSNGMAFTGDLRGFYWTDSSAKTIFFFDYDRETGELSNRRVFWESNGRNTPDGLTIDLDGDLWVAFYDAGCLRRITPDGEIQQEIPLPAANVTSCIFGGRDMSTLFVTSAGGKDEDEDDNPAGALFAVETPATGRAEFASRILLS